MGAVIDSSTFGNSSRLLEPGQGVRTRVLLISTMVVIIAATTAISLLVIRRPLRNLILRNLSSDLLRSVTTFENLQAQQFVALDRENALLADLPYLKALMTTSDERTIADGSLEPWKLSGADLFALADRDGKIVAVNVRGSTPDPDLHNKLQEFIRGNAQPYFVSGTSIYGCSVKPLYFGSRRDGTILGYVLSGFAIDRQMMEHLSRITGVNASFMFGGKLLTSSLSPVVENQLQSLSPPSLRDKKPFRTKLGSESFLIVARSIAVNGSVPLQLVELKSLDEQERSIGEVDRLVILDGVLALVLGTALMFALSRAVTGPLEQLAGGVKAFAIGDSSHRLPEQGTREVRELSTALRNMRHEVLQANRALLESERLATIGRMASSVSHDLRHYLAAVYANSEFLATGKLSDAERGEILADIRSAVEGTTELLESLLVFSRTGPGIKRSCQPVTVLIQKAITIVRAHPDAAGVDLILHVNDPGDTDALVDAKQIERAVCNLLLNACQAQRNPGVPPQVSVTLQVNDTNVILDVVDNGMGVPTAIRNTLFDPFVSEGKQKGTGLGLTLCQCIAAEHGGNVVLLTTRCGETIFRMTIARGDGPTTATLSRSRTEMI